MHIETIASESVKKLINHLLSNERLKMEIPVENDADILTVSMKYG